MKKLIYLLFILSAGCLAGCGIGEQIYEGQYIWENKSDHKITISAKQEVLFEAELQPGESVEKQVGLMGSPPLPPSVFFWEMVVVFDDEITVTYGYGESPDLILDGPFNPTWDENYTRKGNRWTYTFTNADYDAAVAYTQAQEE